MTAQMVTEYQPAIAMTPQAEPCRECGTTGGGRKSYCINPGRARGYCYNCYARLMKQGNIPPTIYANEGEMLWHTTAMVKQSHAVLPGYDARAVIAEAEAFAARELARHPEQARPELSGAVFAFGEAA